MPTLKRLLIPLTAALAVLGMVVPSALASTRQVTMVVDDLALNKDPVGTMQKLHDMGVTMVKYSVPWAYVSPDHTSRTAPAGASTNPSIYDTYNQLGVIDEIDKAAAAYGMRVGLLVTSPAPRWAEGTAGCSASNISGGACRPNDTEFKTFVEALGQRYSGRYVPAGSTTKLPAIGWWSIYNEPNYVPNLAPQTTGGGDYVAADLYRGLLNAGDVGLTATGHGSNTIIFGELAPRGISGGNGPGPAGNGAGIKPVQFLASLYCVTTTGKRLTGTLADENGCPSSASAFKAQNPLLFHASGVADHPYSQGTAPNIRTYDCRLGGKPLFCENPKTDKSDPLWTDLASISNLENGLTKDLKAYGSSEKFPIWNTEYGYWADPPGKAACKGAYPSYCDLPAATAAFYDNWGEYLSYKNPRIASFAQYQLYDPTVGAWQDGLLTPKGAPTAAYNAFEVPLFMPTISTKTAGKLTVWGSARPATVLGMGVARTVKIQFRATSGGWKTLKTVSASGLTGYFTTSVSFGQSGSVRLLYPVSNTHSLTSRTQAITVK
jgi:hypothetical protein